jgi:hypothetical protein
MIRLEQITEAIETAKQSVSNNVISMKKLDIAAHILNTVVQFQKDSKKIHHYEKKIPRIARKNKYSRKTGKRMRFEMLFKLRTSVIQTNTLISQPIPRFPKGGVYAEHATAESREISVVGSFGNEVFIMPPKTGIV